MSFVILQPCCNDASCVDVCPVDCIHPTPEEAPFMRTEMLHIDPQTCIDCGACVDACPVDAIKSEDDLEEEEEVYKNLNSEYFDLHPLVSGQLDPVKPIWRKADFTGMRVAIVGSGPAAFYAALEIVATKGASVTMFERLLTPYGLVRFGVAPDHPGTKAVTDVFKTLARRTNFSLNLGIEIGKHITHDELLARHHAVIYAVGASSDRRLGIDGEDLPGSHTATEFVAWYNGHPDYANRSFDLSSERIVVIGNGNVALDVARILLTDPDELDRTDIADHALEALRDSKVREVIVLGRRGVAQAGYTNPEMIALRHLPDVDLIVDGDEVATDELTQSILDADDTEASVRSKVAFAQDVASQPPEGHRKRLVLRYLASPTEIVGTDRVESVTVTRNRLEQESDGAVMAVATDFTESIDTGLVLRAVGYHGVPVPDLPFDAARGVVPNVGGRVVDQSSRDTVSGVYVTGWIKRGPSGVIGTNKKCATDTVDLLLQDYLAGALPMPSEGPESTAELVSQRQPNVVDFAGWATIDKAEKAAGKARKRPRVKFVTPESILAELN
ncbi:ferredoxin [Rhodococcus erythropolis]|uniref:FAD-dependent oxidoreductase n=1 Tax=Rhodococcus qingshengii TaxID=334542 RepID=UPI000937B0D8|nr:FAD-dependent oxidoreductase [Rhodococcus qingshengii]MCZ4547318.1 FAD-dependent oxidoreductase [Rhodococcus qingshengii]OKA12585.1 ferredoxin [Rhodococcus erythropolis]REK78158.1 4Fe-4S dicluster domain-containing protein [Rhodococcus erythropolis]